MFNDNNSHEYKKLIKPDKTIFRSICDTSLTEFRRFIKEITIEPNVKYTFSDTEYHAINDLTIFGIHNAHFYIDDNEIFSVNKSIYGDIIKLYPDRNSNEYMYFQYVFMLNNFLFTVKKSKLSIMIENDKPVKISFEATLLSDAEYRVKKYCANEYVVMMHSIENLDLNVGLNKFNFGYDLALIDSIYLTEYEDNVSLENMSYVNSNNPHVNVIKSEENTFTKYLRSQPSYLDKTLCRYSGLYYPKCDWKLQIETKELHTSRIINIFHNTLIDSGTYCLPLKYIDVSKLSNYPLTKLNDTEYVEGYWFPKHQKYLSEQQKKYPYPMASDKVDNEIIEKINKLIEDNKLEMTSSLGSSTCRLCDCTNGGNEYSFKIDSINYKFPSGLIHYYKDHGVQPSKEFRDAILSLSI